MRRATPRPVVILGAGRQGRNVADTLRWAGIEILGFLDDTMPVGAQINGTEVLGGFARAREPELLRAASLHVAIGNPPARRDISEALRAAGAELASAMHPSVVVSPSASLGQGLYVGPFVRIAANARIEVGCIIDPFCSIGCDNHLGAYVMLGSHCSLIAGVRIGAGSFLGTHSSVGKAAVGANCIVGAGSVVLRDLPDGVRAQGVPARAVGPADWSRPPV